MQKANLKRRVSSGVTAELGENNPILKALFQRSLVVAQEGRQRHLVSAFMGASIFIVTNIYKDCVKQIAYLPTELPEGDKLVAQKPAFTKRGFGIGVMEPSGTSKIKSLDQPW